MKRFLQCALGACIIALTVVLSVVGLPFTQEELPAPSIEPLQVAPAVPIGHDEARSGQVTQPAETMDTPSEQVSPANASDIEDIHVAASDEIPTAKF